MNAIRSWNDRVFDDNNWAGVIANDRVQRFDKMTCRDYIKLSAELDTDPRWGKDTLEDVWETVRPKAYSLINQVRGNNDA